MFIYEGIGRAFVAAILRRCEYT